MYKKEIKIRQKNGPIIQSKDVRIEPIFKHPIDVQKLGRAFLSLAVELNKDKMVDPSKDAKESAFVKKKIDSGGEYEEDL